MKGAFKLKFDGKELSPDMSNKVISVSAVDESKKKGDTLEIIFDDREEDLEIPDHGDKVELYLGYEGNITKIGSYIVDEAKVKGPPFKMTVSGKGFDAGSKITTRKTRNFKSDNAAKILEQIAKENGLEAKISDFFKEAKVSREFSQCKESDLHYGSRLTDSLGGTMKINDGKLIATKEGAGKDYSGVKLEAIEISRKDIIDIEYGKSKRQSYKSAICRVRNLGTGETKKVEVGSGSPVLNIPEIFPSEEIAVKTARARLNQGGFSSQTISIRVRGDARLSAERPIKLSGFRRGMDGDWIVGKAEHSYSPGDGYRTGVELKKAGLE